MIATQTPTDKELVVAFKTGDMVAYAEIMRRHQDLVYSAAFARKADKDAASELTIKTFMHFWNNRTKIHPDTMLRTYFCNKVYELSNAR